MRADRRACDDPHGRGNGSGHSNVNAARFGRCSLRQAGRAAGYLKSTTNARQLFESFLTPSLSAETSSLMGVTLMSR
jgi:hypothetical protein